MAEHSTRNQGKTNSVVHFCKEFVEDDIRGNFTITREKVGRFHYVKSNYVRIIIVN